MKQDLLSRRIVIGGLSCLLAIVTLCWAGFRFNTTDSEPVGVYWALNRPAKRGDMVFVSPPASRFFTQAHERGYLETGFTPAGTCHLIKTLAAIAGDRVTITPKAVTVNGHALPNSAPKAYDYAGRPMQPYLLNNYQLGADEVLLVSDYNPLSYDSRYFGPVSRGCIDSVLVPLITWKLAIRNTITPERNVRLHEP